MNAKPGLQAVTAGLRAVIYARKSKKDGGRSESRQIKQCRQAVDDNSWDMEEADVFQENASASRFSKNPRREYPKLLEKLESGFVDVLILWEVSRGGRELEGWARLLNLCMRMNIVIHVVKDKRTYNPKNATDWKTLADAGVSAVHESNLISERVKADVAVNAANGRPSGTVLYGFQREYDEVEAENGTLIYKLVAQTVHEERADIVREAVQRAADGGTNRGIARDFRNRGIPCPLACKLMDRAARVKDPELKAKLLDEAKKVNWHEGNIRDFCTNEAYIGIRVHNGIRYPAFWPAIVDEKIWRAANARMMEPGRQLSHSSAIKHLLSGLAICGVCGAKLRRTINGGRLRKDGTRARKFNCYMCDGKHCVSVLIDWLDRYVIEQIKDRLIFLEERPIVEPDFEAAQALARREVADLEQYLEQFTRDAVARRLDASTVSGVTQEVRSQIRKAQARAQGAVSASTRTVKLLVADPTRFDRADIPTKRAMLHSLTDSIELHPAQQRSGRLGTYDTVADRIKINWTESRLTMDPNS